MNKKYMVDPEGKVSIITDEGEIIEREDKYTKNTNEILSLEKTVESIKSTINILKHNIDKYEKKKKTGKTTIILVPISAIIFIIFSAIISKSFEIATLISLFCLPPVLIVEIIATVSYIKNNKKSKKCASLLNKELHRSKKINNKINILSQDKTPAKKQTYNTFIDIKPIYNYNFDASDYFIENYLIDTKIKKTNHSKKKVKKISKVDSSTYQI